LEDAGLRYRRRLPRRDPVDRLLIAQAQVEGFALVTADDSMDDYEVKVVW